MMDISSENGFSTSWWNKTESWENKYKVPLVAGKDWYYFGLVKQVYKERFLFSTTILVAFTDGWHLAQFIFLNSLFIALAINMSASIPAAV